MLSSSAPSACRLRNVAREFSVDGHQCRARKSMNKLAGKARFSEKAQPAPTKSQAQRRHLSISRSMVPCEMPGVPSTDEGYRFVPYQSLAAISSHATNTPKNGPREMSCMVDKYRRFHNNTCRDWQNEAKGSFEPSLADNASIASLGEKNSLRWQPEDSSFADAGGSKAS